MNTRIGQYLSSHPVFALTVLVFSAFAALPVGLFLTFAFVTFIMCAVGFVFIEGRFNHVCIMPFYDLTLLPCSHKPVVFLSLSLSVPVVCRRVESAVCALRHRPLLYGGFTRL